jgi:hypothetical protein
MPHRNGAQTLWLPVLSCRGRRRRKAARRSAAGHEARRRRSAPCATLLARHCVPPDSFHRHLVPRPSRSPHSPWISGWVALLMMVVSTGRHNIIPAPLPRSHLLARTLAHTHTFTHTIHKQAYIHRNRDRKGVGGGLKRGGWSERASESEGGIASPRAREREEGRPEPMNTRQGAKTSQYSAPAICDRYRGSREATGSGPARTPSPSLASRTRDSTGDIRTRTCVGCPHVGARLGEKGGGQEQRMEQDDSQLRVQRKVPAKCLRPAVLVYT